MTASQTQLECRRLVEMIMRAFYEPKYFIIASNLLDMGEKGASETALAARVQLAKKDVGRILGELHTHGIVHRRTLRTKEDIEEEEKRMNLDLKKLHPTLRNRQKYVPQRKTDTVWFFKWDSLVNVIKYRWGKMQKRLDQPTDAPPEWICPNTNCTAKGKIYVMNVMYLKDKNGFFRCPEATCREERSIEGEMLGTRLVITDKSMNRDALRTAELKKLLNIQMQPILQIMTNVESLLSQEVEAHFASRNNMEEEEEDISQTAYGKRSTRTNLAKPGHRAKPGSSIGKPEDKDTNSSGKVKIEKLSKEGEEIRRKRLEEERKEYTKLFQTQFKALEEGYERKRKRERAAATGLASSTKSPLVNVNGRAIPMSQVTEDLLQQMTTEEYMHFYRLACQVANSTGMNGGDDDLQYLGDFDDLS
ncbi:hypothetical protein AAMO2058_001341800 [Amorphochlora amoebiformis]